MNQLLAMDASDAYSRALINSSIHEISLFPFFNVAYQENRLAFVKPDFDYTTSSVAFGAILTKKKKKSLYTSKRNAEFDPNDISVFEEVVKMPPFKRKTLVLIGAQVCFIDYE